MPKHLISFDRVSKSFGSKEIFSNISFSIHEGEHIALIGENGAGKTTLLRCLVGLESCDSGHIQRRAELHIAYLPQESTAPLNQTIEQFFDAANAPLIACKTRMQEIERALEQVATPALLEEYGTLQEAFQRQEGYDIDYRRQEILAGLRLENLDFQRPMHTLSGGEKRRLHLASLLLQKTPLIVLDEPTNHLDTKGLEWLEGYMQTVKSSLLFISHDRLFLNRTAKLMYELEEHGLIRYTGNYDDYLLQKQARAIQAKKAFEEWKEKTAELRSLIKAKTFSKRAPKEAKDSNVMSYDRMGDKKVKSEASLIASLKTRLQELEENPPPAPPQRTIRGIHFTAADMQADKVVELLQVTKAPAIQNLSLLLSKGERLIITGPNGSGKTTLIKLMMGAILPDSGVVMRAPSMRIGCIDQHAAHLDGERSVIEEYGRIKQAPEHELRGDLHKYGLFGDEEVHKLVKDLSEGQKQKLQIACLLAKKPNVLFLDEPTNHLDLSTLEQLEEALLAFEGVIVAVSHDRRFIEKIATRIIAL